MKTILKLATVIILLLPVFAKAQDKAYLAKYAGTYNMLANGQQATSTSDKYVLKPDGKASWTMFTSANSDGTMSNKPTTTMGTWSAKEGLIHLQFNMGEGGDLLSDFKLEGGVFKAEGVFLKKVVAKAKK